MEKLISSMGNIQYDSPWIIPLMVLQEEHHDPNWSKKIVKASQEFGFFQVISNRKLRSDAHRAVTNAHVA
ncbi:hypothetical protein HAX54_004825 [Datura stramonium]|uniref:Uncharacterized protein n=1 Tax=Datura stramonium TaxID=4076 RepID=A0ABS8T8V3_DATST|nr:hypothetical protein [Datura stramonium]